VAVAILRIMSSIHEILRRRPITAMSSSRMRPLSPEALRHRDHERTTCGQMTCGLFCTIE
jgi:hypothetical protein